MTQGALQRAPLVTSLFFGPKCPGVSVLLPSYPLGAQPLETWKHSSWVRTSCTAPVVVGGGPEKGTQGQVEGGNPAHVNDSLSVEGGQREGRSEDGM